MLQGCQCLRGIWAMPLTTALTFGPPSFGQAVGLDGPCRSPPTEPILFFPSLTSHPSFSSPPYTAFIFPVLTLVLCLFSTFIYVKVRHFRAVMGHQIHVGAMKSVSLLRAL